MVYAGFWRRFCAHMIDTTVQMLLMFAIVFPLAFAAGIVSGISSARERTMQHDSMLIQRIVPLADNYMTSYPAESAPASTPAPAAAPSSAPTDAAAGVMLAPSAQERAVPSDFIRSTPPDSRNEQDRVAPPDARYAKQPVDPRREGPGLILTLVIYIAAFGLSIAYHTAFIASTWQATPGKRVMGCVVVTHDGRRLTVLRAFCRHIACAVSLMTLWIGYMLAGWTRQKTALHDLICDTRVVRTQSGPPILAVAP